MMARPTKHKALHIFLWALLLVIVSAGGYALWLTRHYKQIIMERLPEMVTKGSDSIYHMSIKDISVSLFKHKILVYGVRVWADSNQVNILRQQHRYAPNTLSFVYIPTAELNGINWGDIVSHRTFACTSATVRDVDWFMETIKRDPDLSNVEEKSNSSMVNRFTIGTFEIVNPNVTYHFVGEKNYYTCYMKGGVADLHDWVIDKDINRDTSVFLYAKYGSVKPKQFRLEKDDKVYTIENPNIDFTSTVNSLILKNVLINHMADISRQGQPLETYTCKFPTLEFNDFNWNKLLHKDVLVVSGIHAIEPYIDVHYIRANFPDTKDKTGSFPNQIIKEFIKTYIKTLYVKNGRFLYNEPNKKDENALFQFDNINGTFDNITNINHRIAQNDTCLVKLSAKFMNKSPVTANFNLSLSDPKGHFKVVGSISNLDGTDVSKQAAAFTVAKVTSFHLSRMDCRIEGNEYFAKGNFTTLYSDLKISLFKFKSDERNTKNGPFSFLADATILYPSNPMPGKDVRKTTTTLPRDPHNGFMFLIWQNMYLGAQKAAVRDEKFLILAGGDKEGVSAAKKDHKMADKDPHDKKGFFKRLFGKKHK